MRTDLDILKEKIHPTWFSFNDGDKSIVTAVLAAMKEAREGYAKEFAKFVTVRGYQWNEYHKLWISIYHASEPGYTEQEMIDQFNTYQAAIEAEKERGKG